MSGTHGRSTWACSRPTRSWSCCTADPGCPRSHSQGCTRKSPVTRPDRPGPFWWASFACLWCASTVSGSCPNGRSSRRRIFALVLRQCLWRCAFYASRSWQSSRPIRHGTCTGHQFHLLLSRCWEGKKEKRLAHVSVCNSNTKTNAYILHSFLLCKLRVQEWFK